MAPPDRLEQRPQSARTLRARLRIVIGLLLIIAVANLLVTVTARIFGVPFVPPADVVWFNAVSVFRVITGGLAAVLAYSLFRDFDRAIDALKTGAARFGTGELGHEVRIPECAELHGVAERLNDMASRLRKTQEDLRRRNTELTTLAFRDPLTGIANRSMFCERLEAELGAAGPGEDVAILFIDLDNFKSINDAHGHHVGDSLLVDIANRLLNATRGSDTVARLGGDEFALLLPRVRSLREATIVAERVVGSMHAPHVAYGLAIAASASVGVAVGGAEGVTRAEELMRNADVAMYRAKARGRGLIDVFSHGPAPVAGRDVAGPQLVRDKAAVVA
ncbi:MAG: diguanylate cyclase domain-containing protein [Gemmatimonadaceae bacterium]